MPAGAPAPGQRTAVLHLQGGCLSAESPGGVRRNLRREAALRPGLDRDGLVAHLRLAARPGQQRRSEHASQSAPAAELVALRMAAFLGYLLHTGYSAFGHHQPKSAGRLRASFRSSPGFSGCSEAVIRPLFMNS